MEARDGFLVTCLSFPEIPVSETEIQRWRVILECGGSLTWFADTKTALKLGRQMADGLKHPCPTHGKERILRIRNTSADRLGKN